METQSAPSAPLTITQHISRGFEDWKSHWKAWALICLAAFGLLLLSMLALFVGTLFAYGPLAVGMYACALKARRGEEPSVSDLGRGKKRFLHAALAGAIHWGMQALPMVVFFVLIAGVILSVGAFNPSGNAMRNLGPGLAISLFCGYIFFILFFISWTFFIKVRLMFMFPLMAEQNLSWRDAMSMSWEETKTGFWPLLGLQLLASIISGLGAYLCYVGLIFSMPIYFTILASLYRDRFPDPEDAESAWISE